MTAVMEAKRMCGVFFFSYVDTVVLDSLEIRDFSLSDAFCKGNFSPALQAHQTFLVYKVQINPE